MKTRYRVFWLGFALALAASAWFAWDGPSFLRRRFFPPESVPDADRTATDFIALSFPRMTEGNEPFLMPVETFEDILRGLRSLGYHTIGFQDLRDLYAGRRLLPPRALLVSLDRDDPRAVELADDVLRRLRMRGALFLSQQLRGQDGRQSRHSLSPHDLGLLRRGGAWDVGVAAPESVRRVRPEYGFADKPGELPRDLKDCRFRLQASKTGYNDRSGDPGRLAVLPIRWDRPAPELLRFIHASWGAPREFVDGFGGDSLRLEWIPEWGYVGQVRARLALIPRPRQTGATAWLHGTDHWRDVDLEFVLDEVHRSFWAYARAPDAAHFVRMGVDKGWWMLQQQDGGKGPVTLARAKFNPAELPARARFIVKGRRAIAYVDGRLEFGRAVELSGGPSAGRLQFGVYDPEPRAALAMVSWVRARPLDRRWLAFADDAPGPIDEKALTVLRREAPEASGLSPAWIRVGDDGSASPLAPHLDFVRALAGYYNCALAPEVLVPKTALAALEGPAAPALIASLRQWAGAYHAAGLNLRLPLSGEPGAGLAEFVRQLRDALKYDRRDLWVTIDPGRAGPGLTSNAQEVLEDAGLLGPQVRFLRPLDSQDSLARLARPSPAQVEQTGGALGAIWRALRGTP